MDMFDLLITHWIGLTEHVQVNPIILMAKKHMVSGQDFPLDQSNDWSTLNHQPSFTTII